MFPCGVCMLLQSAGKLLHTGGRHMQLYSCHKGPTAQGRAPGRGLRNTCIQGCKTRCARLARSHGILRGRILRCAGVQAILFVQ